MWSYEEWCLFWAMLNSMPEFRAGEKPVPEAEVFVEIRNGKRTDSVMAEVYDAEMAELVADHVAEKCRVRNRRRADRKHPENKSERKKNKQNRMHRLYGLAYEDTKYGKTVYYWDKKEGQKKFPEYEAEIFRDLKERSAEKFARSDWELEQRDIEIARLDAELEAEYAEWEARREWEDMCRKLNEWLKYA